jgi:Caspase domain
MLLIACCSRMMAQDVTEIKYTGADGTLYTGLLVYASEEDAFMRINFKQNGQFRVVHTDYEAITGSEEDINYFFLVGDNARYITPSNGDAYNPDHFIWIQDEDGEYGLPYTSDNAEYDMEHATQVDSYSDLVKGKVTDAYLRSFFGPQEPEYFALRKLFGLEKPVAPVQPVVASKETTLHLMVVANTAIGDIGSSCIIDRRNLESEFEGIAQATGMKFRKYIVEDQQFTKANVSTMLNGFKPGSNDVVVFIYRGHGFRWSNQTEDYPRLDLRYSPYTRVSDATSINLEEIYNSVIPKGARLNLFFADCCNSDIGISQVTAASFMNLQANNDYDVTKLKKLFLQSRGNLISTAASPGEVSWANNANGGFYTVSFLQSLRDEISYLRTDEADWNGLVENTIKGARYKSSKTVCSNCTTQNGIYHSEITYGK